jgi:hypothetical protein
MTYTTLWQNTVVKNKKIKKGQGAEFAHAEKVNVTPLFCFRNLWIETQTPIRQRPGVLS